MDFLKNNRAYLYGMLIVAVVSFFIFLAMNWRFHLMQSLLPPAPPPEVAYPRAPAMPPVVPTATGELLAKYEKILSVNAPHVLAALQPALTDEKIDELEARYHFKLTTDLRLLYLWHDGTPRTPYLSAFPNHEFVPLELAIAQRDRLQKQAAVGNAEQQQIHEMFVAHRNTWIGLIVDLAGDGYFYDPNRPEAEGSFFFNFAETGEYVFFPSFRNYLAAIIDGIDSKIITVGDTGVQISDYKLMRNLWRKYGAEISSEE
jgi:cell wall assembly regulator SMI1